MRMLNCIIYLLISGIIVFLLGRLFPRSLINEDKFLFKSFKFEKNGAIYNKLKIHNWKTKLPDASVFISKIIPNFMPIKRIITKSKKYIKILIKESCIAESTHLLCALLGFYCLNIYRGIGGIIVSISYFILNIPFIIIQRYNRPRLKKLLNKI